MKNLALLILLFSTLLHAQQPYENYIQLWQEVDRFELDNLPKSANEVVAKIYEKAKKDKNAPQLVKSLLFQSKFALILEEDAQLKIIHNLEDEIATVDFPTKNILESVLANLYWQYFQQNRWRFYNRTKTSEKIDPTDFRTWDLTTLFKEVHIHFQNSLENGLLAQQTFLDNFTAILNQAPKSKTYRPTLYDFLAHNALDFYKTDETHLTKPAYKFEIDNLEFLGNVKTFSTLTIETKDSLSLQYHALLLFKNLTTFHEKDTDPTALVTLDLQRLYFVKQHATFSDKEAVFLQTLLTSKETYKTHDISTLYDYEIASLYQQQGQKYGPKTAKENQWKIKEALAICESAITSFPESRGAQKCQVLKTNILQSSLTLTTEEFIVPNRPALILVKHKNMNKLNLKVAKISEKQRKKFQKIYNYKEQLAFLQKIKVSKEWSTELKNEGDFQMHSTEVVLPKLAQGTYLIFATPDLDSIQTFAFTYIQATDLALIETNSNQRQILQVVDRYYGNPIRGAKVHLTNYKSGGYSEKIDKVFTTNTFGQVYLPNKQYYSNVKVSVTYGDKKGLFGNYYIRKAYSNNDKQKNYYQAFLFTDRSIYRPGQTLYFKGIVVKRKPDGKQTNSDVLSNEKVYIKLSDVNGQNVGELELVTNEFGSVSGEFILPESGLTGNFYLNLKGKKNNFNTGISISVEEYKRPKFEIEFQPITDSFKVNDTVKVSGTATAYAGSAITEAKVVYRVHRKVQYPRWWYWYRPMHISEPQEISHGETTTDGEGKYEISFEAIPDKSIAKADLPIFQYEVTADVTDINGETRSSKTMVQVGYHSVLANINTISDWNQNLKEQKISISTTNLNREKVAASGSIKIYKLKAPIIAKRKRPWETPDYQSLTKAEFFKLFPHDSYSDVDEEKFWTTGDLVYSSDFETNEDKETELVLKQKGNKGFRKWQSGKYQIVLETQDRFGQKVTDKQFITLFNDKNSKVADAKLISVQSNKDEYQLGDLVCLSIGSASDNVTVSVAIEKDHKIVNTYIVHLSNEIKTIEIPVKATDIGGFSINYHLVNYNSFVSGKLPIRVPLPQEELSIETLTFRDKVQPGSEQTWSFKLKGNQKDKFAAEFLASMYDASLDQFKTHQWNVPSQVGVRSYYSSYNIGANHSFKNTNFNVRKLKTVYPKYPRSISYDRLNWFGFSLNYNKWQYDRYLRLIKIQRETFDGVITGIVSDETGPLPGVSILIKGTTFGTETDFDGAYSIKVNKDDILVFSYIGMESVSEKVGDKKIIDILLDYNESNVLDEVVVTGYGKPNRKLAFSEAPVAEYALAGKIAGVQVTASSGDVGASSRVVLRGVTSLTGENQPLLVVDGIVVSNSGLSNISPDDIFEIKVLKGVEATALYGSKAVNGVIIVITKAGQARLDADLLKIQARTNFNETAFFYPQLQTDQEGNITFSFTIPEALTRWKLQLLGHTKEFKTAYQSLTTLTQKDLMVMPNAPRFLREGDQITFSSKISNLTENTLSGYAKLVLTDALTGKEINHLISDANNTKSFSLDAKGNTSVLWELTIPDALQAVQYKVVAKAGDFSDGEQNILPVLTNRMLVTESMPMWINSNETKTFTLDKLKDNTSTSLRNHKLTLEVTSNPVWYAVQALPYLMEYPYECSEQTFSRYYANAIAAQIVNSNPKIKLVFDQWKNTDASLSNLEKNQELKSLLIAETPWLRDAQSEAEQKKRIALLFDLNKMTNELKKAERKLAKMQMSNGGFPWFKGSRYPNRYITQHIATGFGHLDKLGVSSSAVDNIVSSSAVENQMLRKAIKYLDDELLEDYNKLIERARIIREKADSKAIGEKAERDYLASNHLGNMQLQYLYMRSFFKDISINDKLQVAIDYYTQQSYTYWKGYQLYQKGLIALVAHRNKKTTVTSAIIKSLDENSITSDEMGMYWKSNQPSWYWYQAPIETQALMIETFAEAGNVILSEAKNLKNIDNLKKWLLKNKQTNRWETTKATTEAVYALLGYGTDWTANQELVEVKIGDETLNPMTMDAVKVEAGTGYFKTAWNGGDIKPEQATVTLAKKDKGIAWGALYWQYFENLDKITHAKTPLQITKKLFLKENSDTGEVITEITDETNLKVGDLVRVRIELKVDREMEFVHMKDMRASGFEPVNVLSQYKWQDGLGYYESTKDASTNFFFDHLRKGVYVFEYDLRANNVGDFSNGITTIQCMYAPEFTSHSEGVRVQIKN